MTSRTYDPARVFVRGFGLNEGIEWGFWLALSVFWIVELGLGPLQLVFLGIALEATVLLSETPTGVVADMHSRRRSILIAQVLMGISFVWSVASTNYWIILPAQVLVGFGWTFRSGADTAWVTDELKGMGHFDDDDVERLLLQKHRFGILAAIVSLVFTMVVGTLTSVRLVAAILGVIYVVMTFYLRQNMREDHFTPGRESNRGFVETLRGGFAVVSGRPRLRVLVVVVLLLALGEEAFDRLGYKHFLDSAEVTDDSLIALGILFLVLAFSGLVMNSVSSNVLGRGHGVARLAVVLLAIAAIGGFIASITSIVVVIGLGYLLQDGVREALWPVLEGWTNRDAPSEVRATVHSLVSQMTSLGGLAGALALGTVAEFFTIPISLTIAALFFALASVVATRGIAPKVGS